MTLSKSSLYMDKRHSISKTFSWLPSPIINSAKDDRHRTNAPFLNTHMNFTAPTLTLSPSSTSSPTTKKLGFFSKFKSSSTDLDQILSSSDEEEEDHHSPRTPRDSQQLASSSSSPTPIAIRSSSSSIILPTISSSPPKTKTPSTDSIPASSLINQSPPPLPPQHASLNQYVQNVLASTFDDVDKTIEMEWDQDRRQLEIDLLTPAPFQYS
ncbi:unnamed protein product [Absidia cylindrospora]